MFSPSRAFPRPVSVGYEGAPQGDHVGMPLGDDLLRVDGIGDAARGDHRYPGTAVLHLGCEIDECVGLYVERRDRGVGALDEPLHFHDRRRRGGYVQVGDPDILHVLRYPQVFPVRFADVVPMVDPAVQMLVSAELEADGKAVAADLADSRDDVGGELHPPLKVAAVLVVAAVGVG